jgi:hypothetical protein
MHRIFPLCACVHDCMQVLDFTSKGPSCGIQFGQRKNYHEKFLVSIWHMPPFFLLFKWMEVLCLYDYIIFMDHILHLMKQTSSIYSLDETNMQYIFEVVYTTYFLRRVYMTFYELWQGIYHNLYDEAYTRFCDEVYTTFCDEAYTTFYTTRHIPHFAT